MDAATRESVAQEDPWIRWFEDLGLADVPQVGGKNASLGELTRALVPEGVRVPGGFATTADAYRRFLAANGLEGPLAAQVERLHRGVPLAEVGAAIRSLFSAGTLPADVREALRHAYQEMERREGVPGLAVAVRSSATAEDLPHASFAGQQESFLNVRGLRGLEEAVVRCLTSLFTDRAISYREEMGFDHLAIALSVGVQRMVRSDLGAAGVLFTLDPETGFPKVLYINAAWGLGESVVKGLVDPDQEVVFKPLLEQPGCVPIVDRSVGTKEIRIVYDQQGGTRTEDTPAADRARPVLSEEDVLQLARWGVRIERHYGAPMDVEWAKDGETGELFIVQARPETVRSRESGTLEQVTLLERGEALLEGAAVGGAVAVGTVRVIASAAQGDRFQAGDILVAERTDPDWGPLVARAGAIVTDHGGRTSHAAIVSRELGIPAVVGTGRATHLLQDGATVTVSCAEGDRGFVYAGALKHRREVIQTQELPPAPVPLLMNLGNPDAAFRWWRLPTRGIGLARIEFIIADRIGVHPMALATYPQLPDAARVAVDARIGSVADPAEFFVERLAAGIARLAAAVHPQPAIVRTSDFKTNEYATLVAGAHFESAEENPMLGFRGASRYVDDRYRAAFHLECRAIRRVRERMGLDNVVPMIPFCRTLDEADRVLAEMARCGLERGRDGLEIYVMCEIPSNVILAEGFAARFDGFSIGSNDLTQLVLGVDRDNATLAPLFDEHDAAVRWMITQVIERAHACGRPVGICGQAPSDDPGFARFLVDAGIDSVSLNPDSIVPVLRTLTTPVQQAPPPQPAAR
ncbi:MAG: phosphoenolpyruvate synthase [Gemmatimonadota bacterium]